MKRRWFIRIFFMLPILLCVGVWVWGRMYTCFVYYDHADSFFMCRSIWGDLLVNIHGNPGTDWCGDGWQWEWMGPAPSTYNEWPEQSPHFHYFYGFGIQRLEGSGHAEYTLTLPFWFLIIVFSTVLSLVWRKTRPKVNPKAAFPVELSKPNEEKVSKAV